jgi:hypothetical protein
MRVTLNVRLAARRGGCRPRCWSFGTGVLGDRRGRPSGRPCLMGPARSPNEGRQHRNACPVGLIALEEKAVEVAKVTLKAGEAG